MSERNSLMSLVFDHLSVAVLVLRPDLAVSAVNSSAEALLGVSERKALGRRVTGLLGNDDWIEMLNWVSMERIPVMERGVHFVRQDGEVVNADLSVSPMMRGLEQLGLLVELQRVERRAQLIQDEHLLSQHATAHAVVRGLAHEIRNPLGGLRGAAQLLARELTAPALKEYTDIIIGEADRLRKLMDRMLGPRGIPHKRRINIHEITDRVGKLIRAEVPDGVRMSCDYDPSIPELHADPDLLIQALLNVTRNALQVLEGDGRIVLRTRILRQFTIGQKCLRLAVQLDVIDSGPGIAEDMLEKIFYPMVSGRAGGTGLGLSIAQSLIQQHDGLIHCTSRPGETVMSIILPLENGK